jgi:hypothetical protein
MKEASCCPTTHSPAGGPVGAAALLSAATRCQHQCSGSKRSPVELLNEPEKLDLDFIGYRRLMASWPDPTLT